MAEELQALLNRINEDGLKKAEQERRELVDKAKQEAERIVKDAKSRADHLLAEAGREAELLREKGDQALRQAARDVMLSLRTRLEERVAFIAKTVASKSITPESAGALIGDIVRAFAEKGGEVTRLEVLLKPDVLDKVEAALAASLSADLRARCELKPVPSVSGGFKLIFNGEDIVYDFSDEALAETLSEFLNPRLAQLLKGSSEAAESASQE